jgi:hypothetical protein
MIKNPQKLVVNQEIVSVAESVLADFWWVYVGNGNR